MRPSSLAIATAVVLTASCANRFVRPSDPRVAVMGRADRSDPSRVRIGYPGVTLRVRFEGPSLSGRFGCTTAATRIAVLVDGGPPRVIHLASGESEISLVGGLGPGPHVVDLVHRTETWQGILTVRGFSVGDGGRFLPALAWPDRRLLFIGDSVTCGEAIDRAPDCADAHDAGATSNGYLSYGMLLGHALGAQAHLVCYGGRGLLRDWRGKTNLLNGPQLFEAALPIDGHPVPWNHADYVPDVVVVSLGTNDFNLDLGPFPEREDYVGAAVGLIGAIRGRYPKAQVFLTEGAIVSDDKDPTRPQKTVLRGYLAEAIRRVGDPHVHLFESRHYPGDACNPHPTRDQHAAMAQDLEPAIRAATGW